MNLFVLNFIRDRIALIWSDVSTHFHRLILSSQNGNLLKERAVVGLLRIANRIMSRDDVRLEVGVVNECGCG